METSANYQPKKKRKLPLDKHPDIALIVNAYTDKPIRSEIIQLLHGTEYLIGQGKGFQVISIAMPRISYMYDNNDYCDRYLRTFAYLNPKISLEEAYKFFRITDKKLGKYMIGRIKYWLGQKNIRRNPRFMFYKNRKVLINEFKLLSDKGFRIGTDEANKFLRSLHHSARRYANRTYQKVRQFYYEGKTKKEMAAELQVGIPTINYHLRNIKKDIDKLDYRKTTRTSKDDPETISYKERYKTILESFDDLDEI